MAIFYSHVFPLSSNFPVSCNAPGVCLHRPLVRHQYLPDNRSVKVHTWANSSILSYCLCSFFVSLSSLLPQVHPHPVIITKDDVNVFGQRRAEFVAFIIGGHGVARVVSVNQYGDL